MAHSAGHAGIAFAAVHHPAVFWLEYDRVSFNAAISVAGLSVTLGSGGAVSYPTALGNGSVSQIYGYNGSSYVALGTTGSIQPWAGYWLWASSSGTLQVPHP